MTDSRNIANARSLYPEGICDGNMHEALDKYSQTRRKGRTEDRKRTPLTRLTNTALARNNVSEYKLRLSLNRRKAHIQRGQNCVCICLGQNQRW